MIDWLRDDHRDPVIEIDGRQLPICIRGHPRAKRLTMRLAPDGAELRVTMPKWGRTVDALAFAKARREWIGRQLAKVPAKLSVANGSRIPYRGDELVIAWQEGGPRAVALDDGEIVFGGPQDRIASRVRKWLEAQALALAADDLAFYCDRAGLDLPELRLTRAQRRWGSCSGEREKGRCVRINWRLVMAPDAVRRSVVAHETAHLVHFDHSPAFHRLLGELFESDLHAADGWLKREGRTLYAAFG